MAQDSQKPVGVNIYSSILQKGELLNFGDKSVKFLKVISDSRCPEEVTCIWAGEAKLLIGVFEDKKLLKEMIVTHSTLNIPYNIPLKFSSEGIAYSIAGLELFPYPTTEAKIPEGEYFLKIRVKEKQ
jgi:hypothetical protein